MTAPLATQRQNILIAGIETHICAYQTADDLKESNYNVQVVEDAVSFRTLANKQLGLEKMMALGILGTSVETNLEDNKVNVFPGIFTNAWY